MQVWVCLIGIILNEHGEWEKYVGNHQVMY